VNYSRKDTDMRTVKQVMTELLLPNPDIDLAIEILGELPKEMECPTLSNLRTDDRVNGWVSFSHYRPTCEWVYEQLTILSRWFILPATLVKWDNYRPSPFSALYDHVPATDGRYHNTDMWPILPYWIRFNNHTPAAELEYFVRTVSGRIIKVTIDLPSFNHFHVRRIEYRGGWRFERGTTKFNTPDHWKVIYYKGVSLAQLSEKSYVCVETENSLSGAYYWMPHIEQEEVDILPLEFTQILLAKDPAK
jgi:hypothetical protein